ncbi:hypothetical protein BWD42_12755 [Sphingobacterium sp. CZ-UAM]|nr:hypothetical protein BWD42_12755 [Sphingobacterium sp. CZ-UAM]
MKIFLYCYNALLIMLLRLVFSRDFEEISVFFCSMATKKEKPPIFIEGFSLSALFVVFGPTKQNVVAIIFSFP